jgi:uncharacterized NAD-dependent epimerase/dehydratase family protein
VLLRPLDNADGLAQAAALGELDVDAVDRIAAETGLPTTDPVRFGPAPLADAVETIL